ncbi:MAG: DUF4252 domain-containing protein [Cyclobacteriaceae bacterium]|nr:DUF4252 domain-containing protein [Cyclobacteriaceae bacterium]
MKKLFFAIAFVMATALSFAQSNSYRTFHEQFAGEEEVFHISIGGFWCRTVLNMAGEHEVRKAIRDISHIRLITVPRKALDEKSLTIRGFRKLLREDGFEELVAIRDHGDNVHVYLQQNSNKKNRYFVLIEEETEVVAIEIKGDIDIEQLKKEPAIS